MYYLFSFDHVHRSYILLATLYTHVGALDGEGGGPQCRLSILRNGNVPCDYF